MILLPMQEGGHPTVLRTQDCRRHLVAQQASRACLDRPSPVSMVLITCFLISSPSCAHTLLLATACMSCAYHVGVRRRSRSCACMLSTVGQPSKGACTRDCRLCTTIRPALHMLIVWCWQLQRFRVEHSHPMLAAGPGMQHMRGHPGPSAWQRPPPHHMMGPRPPPMIPLVRPHEAICPMASALCAYAYCCLQ